MDLVSLGADEDHPILSTLVRWHKLIDAESVALCIAHRTSFRHQLVIERPTHSTQKRAPLAIRHQLLPRYLDILLPNMQSATDQCA